MSIHPTSHVDVRSDSHAVGFPQADDSLAIRVQTAAAVLSDSAGLSPARRDPSFRSSELVFSERMPMVDVSAFPPELSGVVPEEREGNADDSDQEMRGVKRDLERQEELRQREEPNQEISAFLGSLPACMRQLPRCTPDDC